MISEEDNENDGKNANVNQKNNDQTKNYLKLIQSDTYKDLIYTYGKGDTLDLEF